MNAPIPVVQLEDLQTIVNMIPEISKEIGDGSRYIPVLTTDHKRQLIIVRDGKPVTSYGLKNAEDNESNTGLESIEKFLEKFDGNKHLVMLYDDPILARLVEFRYAKKGLKNGELCMYVIPEDDVETPEKIKAQMQAFGIDVKRYESDNSLTFVSIADPGKSPGGFKAGCQKTLDSLVSQCWKPVRMILHVRYLFNTRVEIESHAEFENVIESSFAKFPGSMLCNHYVGKNTKESHAGWTRKMLETHDNVFVVSSTGGIPFITESL